MKQYLIIPTLLMIISTQLSFGMENEHAAKRRKIGAHIQAYQAPDPNKVINEIVERFEDAYLNSTDDRALLLSIFMEWAGKMNEDLFRNIKVNASEKMQPAIKQVFKNIFLEKVIRDLIEKYGHEDYDLYVSLHKNDDVKELLSSIDYMYSGEKGDIIQDKDMAPSGAVMVGGNILPIIKDCDARMPDAWKIHDKAWENFLNSEDWYSADLAPYTILEKACLEGNTETVFNFLNNFETFLINKDMPLESIGNHDLSFDDIETTLAKVTDQYNEEVAVSASEKEGMSVEAQTLAAELMAEFGSSSDNEELGYLANLFRIKEALQKKLTQLKEAEAAKPTKPAERFVFSPYDYDDEKNETFLSSLSLRSKSPATAVQPPTLSSSLEKPQ